MRALRWIGGAAWVGSWYLMWLEITRWHHVKPSLTFDPGQVREGDIRPRAGRPLKMLYVVCAVAPLVVVADWVVRIRTHGGGGPGSRVVRAEALASMGQMTPPS